MELTERASSRKICGATSRHVLAFAVWCCALPACAGVFSASEFSGDADSRISPTLIYTSKADFSGTGARFVNGVGFIDNGRLGANYELAEALLNSAFTPTVTGESQSLVSDFFFTGSSGAATLTLSGLTVGTEYVTTLYNAGFGGVGRRNVNITPGDTNTPFLFDQNFSGQGNGNRLSYIYTATSTSILYTFDAVNDGDSFHHYAFTNSGGAGTPPPLVSQPVISTATGAGTTFAVSNTGLLQTKLAVRVAISGGGNFNKESAGGVRVLTNGLFLVNSGNGAKNELATVGGGSFVQFNLDVNQNIFGYDISSIETFGGWNDAGRDRQKFTLSYSTIHSPLFVAASAINFDPHRSREPFPRSSSVCGSTDRCGRDQAGLHK